MVWSWGDWPEIWTRVYEGVESVAITDGKAHSDPSFEKSQRTGHLAVPLGHLISAWGSPRQTPLNHAMACTIGHSRGAHWPLQSLCSQGVWVPDEGWVNGSP